MNRPDPLASSFFFGIAFALIHLTAAAQEIHKWTDANGKVHYGDRAAAPESSKKIKVAMTPQPQPVAEPAQKPGAEGQRRWAPPLNAQKKSVRVDATRVGPQCKGLIDKIAAVPSGSNWESLYRQFDSACPRIAYECVEYQSRPQDNQCAWVERSGGNVLNRKKYP
jgi:hypothetical protein